jgi:hypothetical protein
VDNTNREQIMSLPAEHPVRRTYERMLRGCAEAIGHAPSDATTALLADNVACAIVFGAATKDANAADAFLSFLDSMRQYINAAETGRLVPVGAVGTEPADTSAGSARPLTADDVLDAHDAHELRVDPRWMN